MTRDFANQGQTTMEAERMKDSAIIQVDFPRRTEIYES